MFDKKLNFKILLDLHRFLDKNNIKHFLFFGTLLGAYRNNDFLSEDIDIVVDYTDYWTFKKLIDSNKDGWRYNCIWGKEIALWKYDRKIDILFYDKKEEFTDFYIYKKNNVTGRWHTEQRYRWKTDDIFPLQQQMVLRDAFWLPLKPENIFKEYYGEQWNVPDTEWNRDRNPAPNLDTEYRQIAIDLRRNDNKESLKNYFLDNYDNDWVQIYTEDLELLLHEPYILTVNDTLDISKIYNLQIFIEIINDSNDLSTVGDSTDTVLPKSGFKTTRKHRSNANGHAYTYKLLGEQPNLMMWKNNNFGQFAITNENLIRGEAK